MAEQQGAMAAADLNRQEFAKPEFWQPGFGNDWLEHFHELSAPEPMATLAVYLPTGWGGAALLLLLGLYLLSRWHINWRRRQLNHYRAQALAQLAQIKNTLDKPEQLAHVPTLLRRCVLSFAERREVASLSGQAWCDCLAKLLPAGDEAVLQLQELQTIQAWAYAEPAELAQLKPEQVTPLLEKVEYWLRHHRAELSAGQGGGDVGV
ncbi:MAG: DUF4381 domain-containing protein [Cellvibrionaceae bacterium]|nr:DUF4381 domain-containing protein [Cellvibrionaceae bacterium]